MNGVRVALTDVRAVWRYCIACLVTHADDSQQPVKGLMIWCQGCGHGGHLLHMAEWFSDNTLCPAGCLHACNLGDHPVVAPMLAERAARPQRAAQALDELSAATRRTLEDNAGGSRGGVDASRGT